MELSPYDRERVETWAADFTETPAFGALPPAEKEAAVSLAAAFLRANGLEDGKFLCCIPRLRKTPYWKIHGKAMTAEDQKSHELNERMRKAGFRRRKVT